MHQVLKNGIIGSTVGSVWEGIGAMFLWDLAEPKWMMFILAIASWGLLGILAGYLLQRTRQSYRFIVKPAIGLCGLIAAKITMELGLIFYRDIGPKIAEVPIIMVTGWLTLAYVLDSFGSPREEVRSNNIEWRFQK